MDGRFTRGYEMGMPGMAMVIALTALGGGSGAEPFPHVPGPSLRITTTAAPDPMIIGTEAVYTLTVTNTGDQDAADVSTTGTLDPNLDPGRLPAACALPEPRTVTCGGPGLTVPPGGSVTYDIPVTTDPALPDGTNITSRAQVSSPATPGDTTQLISRARTLADVEVVRTGSSTAQAGGAATYTLEVTNHGPSQASDVSVQDPAGGGQNVITDRPPECQGGGPALTCAVGALAPGGHRTFTFTVTPGVAGTFRDCATVDTAGRDQNAANNRSCTSTTIEPAPVIPTADPSVAAAPATTPGGERGEEPSASPQAEALVEEPVEEPAAAPGADEPEPVPAGDRAAIPQPESLPTTGVSIWLLGLGVAVLLSIGLLGGYFSRLDRRGRPDRRDRRDRTEGPR
ncbi:hypothetical protein [Nonomuraea sp. NPDC002799]